MSRDALIRGNTVIFLDRSEGDATAIPPGASMIYEADWKNLLGDQKEADYIKALGLVVGR
jgi:hypothetical protein